MIFLTLKRHLHILYKFYILLFLLLESFSLDDSTEQLSSMLSSKEREAHGEPHGVMSKSESESWTLGVESQDDLLMSLYSVIISCVFDLKRLKIPYYI